MRKNATAIPLICQRKGDSLFDVPRDAESEDCETLVDACVTLIGGCVTLIGGCGTLIGGCLARIGGCGTLIGTRELKKYGQRIFTVDGFLLIRVHYFHLMAEQKMFCMIICN